MSDLTKIESSNLAPHLRVLVDDLISMTSDIVLKRGDVAASLETDRSYKLSMYYTQIMNNDDTINMYTEFPEEVLTSLSEWRIFNGDIEDTFGDLFITDTQPMAKSTNTCYMGKIQPDNSIGNVGDGYFIPISYDYQPILFVWLEPGSKSEIVNSLKSVILDDPEKIDYLYITDDFNDFSHYKPLSDMHLYIKEYDADKNEVYTYYDIINRKDDILKYEPARFYMMNINATYYYKYQVFFKDDVKKINERKATIPEKYSDTVKELMRQYVIDTYADPEDSPSSDFMVNRYFGETNQYYRMLNGLPPTHSMYTQPKIDRLLINPLYNGEDINPYVWELTDNEVNTIRKDGTLDKLIKVSDSGNRQYLNFLGDRRIDVFAARQAYDFDILRIGTYDHSIHYQMFINNFRNARDYILYKFYHPELFGDHTYYVDYISFLIVAETMCMCITKSDSILTNDLYCDAETIRNRLRSYGLDMFDDIPLMYRKRIAKYIESLIRNKGCDELYDIILNIFNIDNIEIYKYFYRRKKHIDESTGETSIDLSMAKVPLHDDNFIGEMIKDVNQVDYDKLTGNDPYWGSYGMPIMSGDADKYLKDILIKSSFNYMNSKYISVDSIYNLTKLNYNASYLLTFMGELAKRNISIDMKLDGFTGRIPLYHLIIALFAIQAARLKYDGNIQYDPISVSTILKYNLDDTVEYDNKYMTILEFYKTYFLEEYYKYTNDHGIVKDGIETESDIRTRDSIASEITKIDIPSVLSLDNICESYIRNSSGTGVYMGLLRLRENAKTFKEYECYSNLFKAVVTSKINRELFALKNGSYIEVSEPKEWLKVASFDTEEDGEITTSVHHNDNDLYLNTGKVYSFIKDGIVDNVKSKTLFAHYDMDNGYTIDEMPKTYDSNKNGAMIYCIYGESTPSIPPVQQPLSFDNITIDASYYFYCNIKSGSIYLYKNIIDREFDKEFFDNNKSLDMDEFMIYFGFDRPEKEETDEWINPCYYIQYIEDGKPKIYEYTLYAPTYLDYLKEWCPSLYNEIHPIDSDYEVTDVNGNKIRHLNKDYYDRINELYTLIVTTLETYVSSDEMKSIISSSVMDLSVITEYIIKVINVFKSINVDICTAEMVYELNDRNTNRIRIIDSLSSEGEEYHYDKLTFNDTISTDELSVVSSSIEVRDELTIEQTGGI